MRALHGLRVAWVDDFLDGLRAREVLAEDDLAIQKRVPVVDAFVEDRDGHAAAVVPLVPGGVRRVFRRRPGEDGTGTDVEGLCRGGGQKSEGNQQERDAHRPASPGPL